VVAQHQGADSASVIFDALQSAQARGIDVLIADTAGRLHTQSNLMEELKKIKRVLAKLDPSAPHEVMLVVDAGTGQNALNQAEQFHAAVGLTGISPDQAGRHRQGRHHLRHRQATGDTDPLHRRRRKHRGSARIRRRTIRRCAV
jgi:signal recognition particle GTPase